MHKFLDGLAQTIKRPDFSLSLVTLSVVVVVTGPFGTYLEVPIGLRALYMPVLVVFAAFLMAAVETAVHLWSNLRSVLLRGVAVALILAILASPVVYWVSNSATQGLRDPRTMQHVFLIVFGLSFFFYCLRNVVARDPSPSEDSRRLRDMLELAPGAVLLAVSADDHYVRVLTDQGEHRVLLRFSDALRELAEHEGTQVHRSHWVAKSSAAKIAKRGQSHKLHLKNGVEIPVSRGNLDAARSMVNVRRPSWL